MAIFLVPNAGGGSGSPAGSNTQIQFNSAGLFGASASLTWDGSTLAVTGDINLGDGTKVYKIGNTTVLSATALGSTVQISSSNIPNGTITNDDLAGSIADGKLLAISSANKVALTALDIDGATDLGSALADSDLLIVDDGGGGANKKAAVTRVTDYVFGKVAGDLTIAANGAATAPLASGLVNGFLSSADYSKLAGIEAGAQANVATNLTYTASTRLLESSTGTDVNLPLADGTNAGLMASADFTKLSGIAAGAQVNVATNLTYTASTRLLESSTGTDVNLPLADGTNAGLMASADFTKLSGIAAGAEVNVNADWNAGSGDAQILNKPTQVSAFSNDAGYITSAGAPVQSVNTKSGAVVLNADDIDDTSTTHKFASQAELTKLAGIATGAEVNVNADWNAVSGDAEILNKPTLVTDLDGLSDVTLTAPSNGQVLTYNGSLWVNDTATASSGVPDGDKGDITVSSDGTVWTIDNSAVTYAKIQNVSATDKLLGRSTAGAGVIEEVDCTAAGRALLDDADAATQRITLGLGTLATQNGTFSGTSSGTNTGDQTITLTGDVTGSGTGSFTATIANDAVTYAKIQNVSATDKLLGRSTAGAGDVEEITCTAAGRALLDDVDAAAQRTTLGLGTLATQSGTFSGTSSGTNTGDQTITLTGDVTGSGTGSFAATIANDAVTYAKLQNVSATDKLLGRSTAGAGDVEEITCTAAGRALLDDVDAAAQRTTLGLGTIATLAAPSGDVVGTTGAQTLTNKTVGNLKETVFTITDGAGVDLDPGNGPIQLWTLGANRTATESFAAGESMMLMIADGTAFTLTWPTTTWVGGSPPTLATSGYTVVELWKVGTTLYGARVGDVA